MGLARLILTAGKLRRRIRASPEALAGLQERALRAMLRHAAESVPAYRELYRGIDLDACRLEELPTVTKAEVMDRFDEFVSDPRIKLRELEPWMQDPAHLGRRYLGEFIPMYTSGSTGPRGIFVYTRAALEYALAAPVARGVRFGTARHRFPLQRLARLLVGRICIRLCRFFRPPQRLQSNPLKIPDLGPPAPVIGPSHLEVQGIFAGPPEILEGSFMVPFIKGG